MSATQRVRHLVCYCTRCKLRKKLQTCDTPSATWKVCYSSSLRCKLQEKLPRATCHGLSATQSTTLPSTRLKWKQNFHTVTKSSLPPFSLIRDFGKQNTRGNVSKISVSLACYRQIGSKSTKYSPLAWRTEGHTSGCDWWISIRSVDNVIFSLPTSTKMEEQRDRRKLYLKNNAAHIKQMAKIYLWKKQKKNCGWERQNREKNRELVRARNRIYQRQYRQRHKEKVLEANRIYRVKYREQIKQTATKYRVKNREKIRHWERQYRQKEVVKERNRFYQKRQRRRRREKRQLETRPRQRESPEPRTNRTSTKPTGW